MNEQDSTILVTGAAGFIGSHLAHRLLDQGHRVVGIDNINSYYDPYLKMARLDRLRKRSGFRFECLDISKRSDMERLFAKERFPRVFHMAAQAGVRYSMENPYAYLDSNLSGFLNILEGCRKMETKHLVYASSSSVYGLNETPFSVDDRVDHPVSFYAATKKANELMAHSYSYAYGMPMTGLRFFTVYGPWGRPDMALFLFTRAILEGRPVRLFNHGKMWRDFTYVDDIVEGIVRVGDLAPVADVSRPPSSGQSPAPWRVFNIGNRHSEELRHFLAVLEDALGKKAVVELLPMQPGDLERTEADIDDLEETVGFRPTTPIEVGIPRFVEWYRQYYTHGTTDAPN